MDTPVTHDRVARRFVSLIEGHTSAIDYALDGDVMTILHTNVPEPLAGRGIAGALTREALATARSERWSVVPACSYARAFIEKHPEYQDLLAKGP